MNRPSANNQMPASGGDLIRVFNQEGEKIMTYHLDTYINGFTIDERNRLLIGISSNSDQPIYLFHLE
jgi:hypothetical protein